MITHHKTVFLFSLYINAYEVEHLDKNNSNNNSDDAMMGRNQ